MIKINLNELTDLVLQHSVMCFFWLKQKGFRCHCYSMSENRFWESKVHNLIREIDQYLDQNPNGVKVAAFDADGTCWFNDVGRDFYLYQCETVFKDLWKWQDYVDREKVSVADSLWWLAEINKSVSTSELLKQAKALIAEKKLEMIPSQQFLIEHLLKKGVEVYIVTASVKWSVVPAAFQLGIGPDHVLGVTTKLDATDCLTMERFEPITWREGKPLALLQATQGIKPFLCSGNTISDKPLIESSTHFKISVNSVDDTDTIFQSEQQLKDIAHSLNWWHFDYLNKV